MAEYIVNINEEEVGEFDFIAITTLKEIGIPVVRCRECKHWDRKDGMFPDIDGNDWHGCEELSVFVSASGDAPCTPAWWYCAGAKRIDNDQS